MTPTMAARHQQGWSLVELAVFLVIASVLGVLLVTMLPLGGRVMDGDRQQRELAQADQALLGYMRTHGHLPSADTDGNGVANGGALAGWLPVSDLGLSSRMRIRYQVQSNLAAAPTRVFQPLLPPDYQSQQRTASNGLDLCMQLLMSQRSALASAGLGMPLAYYLRHAGDTGHASGEAPAWDESAQAMPGAEGGMSALAAGPGELASRLACPDRLARTQGGAQAAYAAYSALRISEFNREFREFDVKIGELIVEQATTARNLAIYRLADAISSEAVAIVLTAAGWPPDKAGIVAGTKYLAGKLAGATLSLGIAIYGMYSAQTTLDAAEKDLDQRELNLDLVTAQRDRVRVLYENASSSAITLDNAGLQQ